MVGKLRFPMTIGYKQEIGDYIHVQEFYENQLKILFQEVGFVKVNIYYCFFGLQNLNICFTKYPSRQFSQTLCQFLFCVAKK